jgi:hypothetical protein
MYGQPGGWQRAMPGMARLRLRVDTRCAPGVPFKRVELKVAEGDHGRPVGPRHIGGHGRSGGRTEGARPPARSRSRSAWDSRPSPSSPPASPSTAAAEWHVGGLQSRPGPAGWPPGWPGAAPSRSCQLPEAERPGEGGLPDAALSDACAAIAVAPRMPPTHQCRWVHPGPSTYQTPKRPEARRRPTPMPHTHPPPWPPWRLWQWGSIHHHRSLRTSTTCPALCFHFCMGPSAGYPPLGYHMPPSPTTSTHTHHFGSGPGLHNLQLRLNC